MGAYDFSAACAFTDWNACPLTQTRTLDVDTTKLPEGAYPLRLECFKAPKDKTSSIALLWKPPHGAEQIISVTKAALALGVRHVNYYGFRIGDWRVDSRWRVGGETAGAGGSSVDGRDRPFHKMLRSGGITNHYILWFWA